MLPGPSLANGGLHMYALLRRQTTTGTPHVEINPQDLQVVQTANTSD